MPFGSTFAGTSSRGMNRWKPPHTTTASSGRSPCSASVVAIARHMWASRAKVPSRAMRSSLVVARTAAQK